MIINIHPCLFFSFYSSSCLAIHLYSSILTYLISSSNISIYLSIYLSVFQSIMSQANPFGLTRHVWSDCDTTSVGIFTKCVSNVGNLLIFHSIIHSFTFPLIFFIFLASISKLVNWESIRNHNIHLYIFQFSWKIIFPPPTLSRESYFYHKL